VATLLLKIWDTCEVPANVENVAPSGGQLQQ